MKKKIITILVLSSIFAISGCNMQENAPEKEDSHIESKQKTYAEIAETLTKFEIGGITEQLIDELEASYAQMPPEIELDKTAMLLSALGMGTFDYEQNTWTPSANGVYSFDAEVFDIENMYTDFLLGVSALDADELHFENIREDTSKVNWDEGTGTRTVSFEWKGKAFCLEAEMEHDWFDLDVANGLNKIIIENQSNKRLFFASDGYQECIVFYRSTDWAEAFQEETGVVLSELN